MKIVEVTKDNLEMVKENCQQFFEEAKGLLADTHYGCVFGHGDFLVPNDAHVNYLDIPSGTIRFGNKWNYRAGGKKCPEKPNRIQAFTRNMPRPFSKRRNPMRENRPVIAVAVAKFKEGKYEVLCGECFNAETNTWVAIIFDSREEMRSAARALMAA